jgi:spermidine synthase
VTRPPADDPRLALIVLGIAAGIGQALLLREAMAATGGSELAWGTVMSLWLVGMAVGSRAGARIGGHSLGRALAPLTLLLTGIGIVLFRAAPALTGAASGETVTAWHAAWLWAAAVVPPALAGGLAFPILAGRLSSGGAGHGYGLEAGGALIGGLALSLVLAPLGSAAALCLTAALVVLVGPWPRRHSVSIVLAVVLAGSSVLSGELLAAAGWRWAGHPGELGGWRETRRQRLEASAGAPTTLYADGRLAATFPDAFTTVPAAHLLMLLHPRPERVLAVGCLADGAISTMARHPAAEILVVEDDPQLPPRLREWYGPSFAAALADPRVRVLATDPLRALARPGTWDLIVLRDGDPITVRRNRTRTVEFYDRCRARLAADGALVVRLGVPDTYLGGSAGRLLEVTASSLRRVFPKVLAVPGESILLVAGGDAMAASVDPAELERRWQERGIEDELFAPEMLELLLDPRRAAELARVVDAAAAPVNTMEHPRAVLLAAGLHEARGRPSLLGLSRALEGRPATPLGVALAAAMAAVLVLSASRRQSATAIAAVIGACSMGWWLLLIAAWQSTLGSVFAEIGALNAAFMAGLAAGSLAATRRLRPSSRLPLVLLAGCLLSALLAAGAAVHLPALTVPLLLAVGGALTGAAFAAVAGLAGRGDTRRGAGVAFAADESGAAIAALVVGILALPWAGMTATAVGLALLGLAALPGACRAGARI